MDTVSTTAPAKNRSTGRGYFWAGIGLAVLGVALTVVQYSLKQLIVPWYLPALTTLGVILLLGSVVRRRGVARIVTLVLIGALAGAEWYFLVSLSKLPAYQGPARTGQKMPAFQTTRADGRPFTDRDLQEGQTTVMVFFRGRW